LKGFVPTPEALVDLMVDKLFRGRLPSENERVLDPGAGRGAFVDGILRWCAKHRCALPSIVAIESDPQHAAYLRDRFAGVDKVDVREIDFLAEAEGSYEYVVGNPPYVAITGLSDAERVRYRANFTTAKGRFDLYLLFFEQSIRLLKPSGRLVFVTPEKFTYVESAASLRGLLSKTWIEELHFLDEESFPGLVTYPVITTLSRTDARARSLVLDRQGTERRLMLPVTEDPWLPALRGAAQLAGRFRLEHACKRISCGVATGADAVFVTDSNSLDPSLRKFAHPTVAGRDLISPLMPSTKRVMLVPYDRDGKLLPESELGALYDYLIEKGRHERLLERTCVLRKPWYAFHENPPMRDLLQPKLLCKDIGVSPRFVIERAGDVIPRHSVYYLVPALPSAIDQLADYLNSASSRDWLRDNCQRAANGFLRLQSHVLKRLPIPDALAVAVGVPNALGVALTA
jgi:adenine-specific DNA-methyltransferase